LIVRISSGGAEGWLSGYFSARGSDAMVRIVLYHQPALDVTDRVVKEFDLQNK
jgi:hypothetical protein